MHIHILGICGTFMAGVAALARSAGHRVTGADRGVYPPMSEQLSALGIDIIEGYDPDQLDITRSPNRHMGFGFGMHFCLGAQLARMETRIGIKNLVERFPDLRLDVDPAALEIAPMPGWHRHTSLPVAHG